MILALSTILGALLIVFLLPMITFGIAYLGGMIAQITFGDNLAYALNVLFNTNCFTPNMIPWVAAALGYISGFFKTINIYENKGR